MGRKLTKEEISRRPCTCGIGKSSKNRQKCTARQCPDKKQTTRLYGLTRVKIREDPIPKKTKLRPKPKSKPANQSSVKPLIKS